MTHAQRQINLQFSDQTQSVDLEGLKVQAIVSSLCGDNMHNFLELRAWGVSLQQMERYSNTGSQTIAVEQKSVRVSVGNVGSALMQVFGGTIVRSALDFTQAPNVCLAVSGVAGYYYKGTPAPANSFKGAHNAEDIIAGLAKAAGFTFVNNGAHAVLQKQYLYPPKAGVRRRQSMPGIWGRTTNMQLSPWHPKGRRDRRPMRASDALTA